MFITYLQLYCNSISSLILVKPVQDESMIVPVQYGRAVQRPIPTIIYVQIRN